MAKPGNNTLKTVSVKNKKQQPSLRCKKLTLFKSLLSNVDSS